MHTIIIGGTKGIGRCVAEQLSNEGHIVSALGRNTMKYPALHNVKNSEVNITDNKATKECLKELIEKRGKPNNLIFSLRFRGNGDMWTGELETSLTSTKNIIDYLSDKFDGESSIVIVNSIASKFIATEQPLGYHVAKAGLIQMVRYYALILGKKGIRVNSVSPCTVIKEESKQFYEQNEKLRKLYEKITPLGRMCKSEDIANVIDFLCSNKSSFITGQDIMIDGGISLQWHESLARDISGYS